MAEGECRVGHVMPWQVRIVDWAGGDVDTLWTYVILRPRLHFFSESIALWNIQVLLDRMMSSHLHSCGPSVNFNYTHWGNHENMVGLGKWVAFSLHVEGSRCYFSISSWKLRNSSVEKMYEIHDWRSLKMMLQKDIEARLPMLNTYLDPEYDHMFCCSEQGSKDIARLLGEVVLPAQQINSLLLIPKPRSSWNLLTSCRPVCSLVCWNTCSVCCSIDPIEIVQMHWSVTAPQLIARKHVDSSFETRVQPSPLSCATNHGCRCVFFMWCWMLWYVRCLDTWDCIHSDWFFAHGWYPVDIYTNCIRQDSRQKHLLKMWL